MSLSEVRPYFKARCLALSGFKEHKDAFNWENIGSTAFNRAFHIMLGDAAPLRTSQPNALEISQPVTVRLFFNGYRDPHGAVDTVVETSETLIKDCLKLTNRLGGVGLKNITFGSMAIEPFHASNDNAIISTLNFTALVMIDAEGS